MTQNGYPDEESIGSLDEALKVKKYPLTVDYYLNLINYEILSPHDNKKIRVERLPIDTENIVILRSRGNYAKANIMERAMYQRRISPDEMLQILKDSSLTKHVVHSKSVSYPNGIYSTKDMSHNNHCGKLIKNETTNLEIEVIVKSTDSHNLELHSRLKNHKNIFKAKLGP